jgi:hypothetical protein
MSRLRLNTIISLTPEPPTSDLLWFSDMAKITVMYSPVNRLCPINDQLQTVLINALNVSRALIYLISLMVMIMIDDDDLELMMTDHH